MPVRPLVCICFCLCRLADRVEAARDSRRVNGEAQGIRKVGWTT